MSDLIWAANSPGVPPTAAKPNAARRSRVCGLATNSAIRRASSLNKEILAKRFREHLRSQASNQIGRPAGRIGHDDADRAVGVVGRSSRTSAGKQRDAGKRRNKISTSHCGKDHSITSSAAMLPCPSERIAHSLESGGRPNTRQDSLPSV
jgi:hypothetical protein